MCTALPIDRMRGPLSFTVRPPMFSEGMSPPSGNGHRNLVSVPDESSQELSGERNVR
jgi:hypothetical protein